MERKDFIKNIISETIAGKNEALHAYDKMMWMIRTGYLTLVFAGWSLIIKAAVENNSQIDFYKTGPYILIISAFSIALALSGYRIDKEYAKRKFRLITSINKLMRHIVLSDFEKIENEQNELVDLLKISGDTNDLNYKSEQYNNEIKIINTIYLTPAIVILFIILFLLKNILS